MSGLFAKAKELIGGHHEATSENTDLTNPETVDTTRVEASGGTYDAGPGVGDNDSVRDTTAPTAGSTHKGDNYNPGDRDGKGRQTAEELTASGDQYPSSETTSGGYDAGVVGGQGYGSGLTSGSTGYDTTSTTGSTGYDTTTTGSTGYDTTTAGSTGYDTTATTGSTGYDTTTTATTGDRFGDTAGSQYQEAPVTGHEKSLLAALHGENKTIEQVYSLTGSGTSGPTGPSSGY